MAALHREAAAITVAGLLGVLLAGATSLVVAAPPPGTRDALAVPVVETVLPALDATAARRAADALHARVGGPLPYAEIAAIDSAGTKGDAAQGRWEALPDGRWSWRMDVRAPGALTLEFAFEPFRLPASAELWITAADGRSLGPFTDKDNSAHGALFTPMLAGDHARIELVVDADQRDRVQLALAHVARGYRGMERDGAPVAKSISCNVDVACSDADPWRAQVGSVARYTFVEGSTRYLCTGQLMVDASGTSAQRLFSTANHCVATEAHARSMVLYWRYESDVCRTPGSAASGNVLPISIAAATQDGADLLATHADSDFTLVRLDDPVPSVAQPFFSGWDRVADSADTVASIHHPQGHEKRISVERDDVFPTTTFINVDGISLPPQHGWEITGWDEGTTEGGSSGSGLWNEDRRLIGVLSNGTSGCGNEDVYGRLKTAWEGDGTPSSRMRDWLDPAGTGAAVADGVSACPAPTVTIALDAAGSSPLAGEHFTLRANASGGSGAGYTFEWDLDDDGVIDRSGTAQIALSYPAATSTQVSVRVVDNAGCGNLATRALDVRGPEFSLTAQAPQQLCGDNDASIEPGERWRVPVALRNSGDGEFATAGRALFAPGGGLPIGPDAYGYAASTSNDGGCDYSFVDISSGSNAVATLPTAVFDGNTFGPDDDARTVDPIPLQGVRIYGQPVTEAVMSTNGYISFSDAEGGGDFSAECPVNTANNDSVQPRLHVLHDDLVIGNDADAGLRHRYFAACPRGADSAGSGNPGCHVFQWNGMAVYSADGYPVGNFDFQALLYSGTGQIVYQYRSAAPDGGGTASIGLIGATEAQGYLSIACATPGAAPAQSAVCIFDPAAQPATGALRLETPAPVVAVAAVGASQTLALDFAVPGDAACGTPLVLDFRGAANATQSAPAATSLPIGTLGGTQGSCSIGQCAAQVPAVDARQGLFFNAARAGNGLLNFRYGSVYGGVWYTAFADRTPAWYTLQGDYADNLAVTTLRSFINVAAPGGFQPVGEIEGAAWVAQPSRDEVLFSWQFDDGRAGIELLGSIGLPFAQPNRTQMWYAPSQSGWGNAVESNAIPGGGYSEFWATFLFDAAGVGRWVSGASGEREGVVPLQAQRVHCPGCPFLLDQLQLARPAGSLSRTFSGADNALLDTDIVLPAPLSGRWDRDNLPIVPLGPVDPQ